MKSLKTGVTLVILCLGCINLNAGKIYTRTDPNGVTHISENPPPATGKLEAVIEYTPQTEEEIRIIRQQQESRRNERAKESILRNALEAQKIADEASIAAEDAKKRADEANRRALEFKNKVGKNSDRIKRNRSKIRKLELEALNATDAARQASEVARKAEEQAKSAEKRATEIIKSNNQPERQLTETKK
jgi:membrane protein involved in colicin uptake